MSRIEIPTREEFAERVPQYGPRAKAEGSDLYELVMQPDAFLAADVLTSCVGLPAVTGRLGVGTARRPRVAVRRCGIRDCQNGRLLIEPDLGSPSMVGRQPVKLDIDRLRADIAAGRTITSIAVDHGVSHSTVSRRAHRAGITVPRRPPPITTGSRHAELNDPAWLATNYATRTVSDIAAELGVTVSTVNRALDRQDITFREPGVSRHRRRPAQLHDSEWLRTRYEHATATTIAEEVGVNPQMVYAAMRHHGIERRPDGVKHRFNSRPQLDDADWLRQRFIQVSAPVIADELGVTRRTVYLALERHGIDVTRSPWINRGHVRLTAPDGATLRRVWEVEETLKGVARQFEVSVNTAAVWLADIGIFIQDTPVISRRELQNAISQRLSIDEIRRKYRVTGRTVHVELRRQGLLAAHKNRHLG